ncbi:2-hydroxyacid dehydrogenase [Aneurinibacillus migulanus]|uniref:2-hydroxyacid dehydrogenase n=1 Tax=Aneurinibacillus migulanus TaxID=47500 RepID=UPI00209CCDFD|nr:2-hydroxyacid dehydrogenase [Aneurinibacillus migulanus]MCP1354917.1 2-hydroxyacid dehydrogenase [Aneurinibacillus migulanus]
MKCLAIADLFIPAEMMEEGLKKLKDSGVEVTVREWKHENLEHLQKDNLAVEQGGSEALDLPESLLENISEFDIIITQFAPVNRKVIEQASNLKIIGVLRGGIENVNEGLAKERGIMVLNTPGRNARSVAEFTVGLILSEIRNIARSHAALKKADWRKEFPNSAFVPELEGRTLGIIGFGNVGQLVGRFLNGFGMRIIFHDPYFKGESSFPNVGLDTLVEGSDIVTLHGRLTEDTMNLINREHFLKMKPTAIIVNTARSGLVNEKDLIDALQNNLIAGAAIDVFDQEPLPENHPFLTLDNVTITPHMAGSTVDAFANTPKKLAAEIAMYISTMNEK